MCRTAHAVLSTVICGIQMLVRVFMTVILMLENVIRMLLQTFYNFISFVLQMISLIPICFVFLLTARLKCFMCGGGGPCPVGARGGTCDCVMSFVAVLIIFLIFRATGVLDKVLYSLGYTKSDAPPHHHDEPPFIPFNPTRPTRGEPTKSSRNDIADTTETTVSTEMSDTNYYNDIYNYSSNSADATTMTTGETTTGTTEQTTTGTTEQTTTGTTEQTTTGTTEQTTTGTTGQTTTGTTLQTTTGTTLQTTTTTQHWNLTSDSEYENT